MFIATLIAAETLSAGDISSAADRLAESGATAIVQRVIEPGKAIDLGFTGNAAAARTALEGMISGVDVVIQLEAVRRRRLLVADMDSTMITVECIDELADYAGIKAEIAAVTEAAMRGELDFANALRSRVALLKGLPDDVIEQCLAERVQIMPGARALVGTVRSHGGYAVLVSGGFTRFADPVGSQIGFDRVIANRLGVSDGALDGSVASPIIDAQTKRDTLLGEIARHGWSAVDSVAVGDGANDIPMIKAAGLGVAYHAKPKTRDAAAAAINQNDLGAILFAMGYPRRAWVETPHIPKT